LYITPKTWNMKKDQLITILTVLCIFTAMGIVAFLLS
jgi:hypothetical protein